VLHLVMMNRTNESMMRSVCLSKDFGDRGKIVIQVENDTRAACAMDLNPLRCMQIRMFRASRVVTM
jgi:hypothetical protein